MENLAKAIVDSAHLVGQVLVHFSGNQVGADLGNQTPAASTIASYWEILQVSWAN